MGLPALVQPFPEEERREAPDLWTRRSLAGRLCELFAPEAACLLSPAFALVVDAQREGESVAWLSSRDSLFYPPDAEEAGADLRALLIVRVPDARASARAAEKLVRSGAYGLIVLDVGDDADVPLPLQSRLLSLAQKHECALLFLTERPGKRELAGSLVSLRAEVRRRRAPSGFVWEVSPTKDKKRSPTWRATGRSDAPLGLR